ncbi:MAG: sugar transporter [Sphingobacteriales bacterium]|nr:sugar transporter [Sphingobacteriales bacterium]
MVLKATIEKGWYLYSQYLQDGGPVPTSIQFKEEKGITIADKIEEKGLAPKSGYDELFQMDITKYAQEATFTARVKQKKATPATLQGSVEFMTCDDTKCLPPDQVDFSFELK